MTSRSSVGRLRFALCAFAAVAATAQDEPGIDLGRVFSEVIDVRVVNIEVVVTDRDGVRVHGLEPDDFILRLDGEERSIDYFSEILGGEQVAPPAPSAAGELVPAAPGIGEQGPSASYLVFVDEAFAIARDRDRVLDGMIDNLDFLDPRDRMAIVAYDGRGLEMLANWTSSREQLRRTLLRAKERKTLGLQRMGDLRTNDQDRSLGRFRLGGLTPLQRNYAQRLADQVEQSVQAAVATLRSFAGPPGRKVMLLLTGGWPFSPAEFAVNSYSGAIDSAFAASLERGIPGYHELFSPLSDTANLLGYTLYPVDVPGMGSGFASGSRRARSSQIFGREGNLHSTLDFLAAETGGEAMLNASRSSVLERVAGDTRSYYWLGVALSQEGDDRRHRIEVDVLLPGARVRSREGFVDLSRRAEVSMMVESSLLFGNPAGERPLDLRFGRAEKAKRGIVAVPLEVGFPLDDFTLLPLGGAFGTRAEVRVTVMDEAGNRSETPIRDVEIVGEERPEPGDMYWWQTTLMMRKRRHRVVVAVFDPISGDIYSSYAEIEP